MPAEMPSHFPQRVVAYLVDHRQIPLPEIITAVGLPPEVMLRDDVFLSEAVYLALVRFAIDRTDDPGVGLGYGRNLQLSDFGMLGYAAGAQATVAEGIELFARHYDGMSRLSRLAVEKGSGYYLRVLLEPGLPEYMVWFLSEAIVAAALQNLARLRVPLGRGINAHFAYPRPSHCRCYEDLQVPCYFSADTTGVYVSEKVLSLPLGVAGVRAPWPDSLGLSDHAAARSGYGKESLDAQLASIVRVSLPRVPTLPEVAQRLGVSPRKLQRQLERHGLGFRQRVGEIRVGEAAERLLRSTLPVRQVAEQTGFSDQASFTRAFRRVFGLTPGQYRQNQYQQKRTGEDGQP
ncbi:AraC family transcriptional regulator [Marinobacter fonticola]|uniref:AraC family transcriptional regulator n=1 Tax=Marinobacter fonticola TaxID=2603215 RepID=UPI0011E845B9|nr:AraC family transcriptional regulator [Marinobacter fonticola]